MSLPFEREHYLSYDNDDDVWFGIESNCVCNWCGDVEYAKLNERDAWNERWKKGGEEELIVFACFDGV